MRARKRRHRTSSPLSHLRGLGVAPADGRAYVATHDGLYTVAKEPKLGGDRKDDFMGFTVTGKNALMAERPGHGLRRKLGAGPDAARDALLMTAAYPSPGHR